MEAGVKHFFFVASIIIVMQIMKAIRSLRYIIYNNRNKGFILKI